MPYHRRVPLGQMLALVFFLTAMSLFGAGRPDIPYSDFRLDDWLEILIVFGVAVLAAAALFFSFALPIGGLVLRLVILLPIVEEFIFRYILLYAIALWGRYNNPSLIQMLGAFLIVGIGFGLAHAFIAFFSKGWDPSKDIFTAPAGIQVGEGLFLGMLNGLIFLNFIYFYNVGLLMTMVYVWIAHITINGALVAYNIVVNVLFGGSFLLHLLPRLGAGLLGAFWFWYCWAHTSIRVPWI